MCLLGSLATGGFYFLSSGKISPMVFFLGAVGPVYVAYIVLKQNLEIPLDDLREIAEQKVGSRVKL
jgi:hypothetical protein